MIKLSIHIGLHCIQIMYNKFNYTHLLQEEIKLMQDAGNKYAKDLAEAEEPKWKQQYESLHTQFTAVNEEFTKHKVELQARAVKLDQVEANLNTLAGSTGMTLQQAINHLTELKEAAPDRKKSITELECISSLEMIKNNKWITTFG